MHDDHLTGIKGCFEDTESEYYGKHDKPKDAIPKYNAKDQTVKFTGNGNAWNFGNIYCGKTTYNLMLVRFPDLKEFLIPVNYNEEYVIDEMN